MLTAKNLWFSHADFTPPVTANRTNSYPYATSPFDLRQPPSNATLRPQEYSPHASEEDRVEEPSLYEEESEEGKKFSRRFTDTDVQSELSFMSAYSSPLGSVDSLKQFDVLETTVWFFIFIFDSLDVLLNAYYA